MAVVVCPSCRRNVPGNPYEKNMCPECGGIINPGDFRQGLVRGTKLYSEKFEVEKQIGRGGFAITYLVKTRIGRDYVHRVIKEYFPNEFAETKRLKDTNMVVVRPGRQMQYDQYHEAFNLEASHMDDLRDVPGVVKYYDFFEENNTWYIVMEALTGQDLFHYTISQPAQCMQLNEAVNIIRQIMQIMAKVYRVRPTSGEQMDYSLIHRDLSMGNVFVSGDGKVTILDFGSARYMFEPLDPSSKAHYTPVEQIENGKNQGQYTDIYAVGKLFYFLLCGKWPHDVSNREWKDNKAKYTLPPVRELRPEIPAIIDEIIQKATRYDYHERYQTAEEFLKALDRIGKPSSGARLIAIGVSVAAAAGLLAVILMPKGGGKSGGEEPVVQITSAVTMAPTAITTEFLKEYAYFRAAQGAALCTQKDKETAIAATLTEEVVYVLQQEGDWSHILLNLAGQEGRYYMESRFLQQLSRTEAEEYETLASVDGSAIRTQDNHYLQEIGISPVQQETTAAPTLEPTEAPTVTLTAVPTQDASAQMRIFVEFVDEDGTRIDEALYEVGYGEDLTIEAGKITDRYEIPQATTYAIQWGVDGRAQNGPITVQCQPTPVPAPVRVTVRYMTEAGELLAEDEVQVSYEQNFFIPRTNVGDYSVVISESPVVSWNEDGVVQKSEFVFYCVPPVTLVYGQNMVVKAEEMNLPQDVPLTIESDGYVTAEQTEDGIRITAERPGDGQITVSDGENSYSMNVRVIPAVRALSSLEVVLDDGQDEAVVALDVEEGAEIKDFSYSTEQEKISVVFGGEQLRFKASGYVNDWVVITVGGRSFRVNVRMKDQLESLQLYRVNRALVNERTAWVPVQASTSGNRTQVFFNADETADEVLLIQPVTQSGSLEYVTGSGAAVFNEVLGVYEVDLSGSAWQQTGAQPVTIRADDSTMDVAIYTADVVSNRSSIVQTLNGTLAAGSTKETNVELHPAVEVLECSTADEEVATAVYAKGRLTVTGMASGDTEIRLKLSQGEVIRIPVSVRQRVEQLNADVTSVCVGEEIAVQIISRGTALTDEFAIGLDNASFTVVGQTVDSVVLRAERVGSAELTVTDTFGNTARVSLRASSTVTSLDKKEVSVKDGGTATVQIQLVEGKKLPDNVQIIHDIEGLKATRKDTKITFAVEENRYVSGTVVVDVNGEQFSVQVSTKDRVTGVTVYSAAVADLKALDRWTKLDSLETGTDTRYTFNASSVKDSCMIFDVDTLSGGKDKLKVSELLDYDQENDIYFISLGSKALKSQDTPALIFAMDGTETSVGVYTGELLNNMNDILQTTSAALRAGQSVQIGLSLYEGASVRQCVSGNEQIAAAVCQDGRLTIHAEGSGETTIRLTMEPTGEVWEIPVTVRQSIEGLTAEAEAAYLGQTISVSFNSQGRPLEDEFVCTLEGSSFATVERTADTVILRADAVGESTMTVTDTFGSSKTITLTASSAVTGLSASSVLLTDGEAATVEIGVAKGMELPENITIRNSSDALEVKRTGRTISLKVEKGAYVSTTVEVVADGIAYPLKVSTEDRLLQISVWRADANKLQQQETWEKLDALKLETNNRFVFDDAAVKGECLVFAAESLSGSLKQLALTGGLTMNEKQGICYIALDDARFKKQDAEKLSISLGTTGAEIEVYTGDLVTNLSSIKENLGGTLTAGKTETVNLKLYADAAVAECRTDDPGIAVASIADGKLAVTSGNSGNTVVRLTMQPTGEVITIPVTVRQKIGALAAASTTAYIGESIVVNIGSEGRPMEDEFTCQLTGSCFEVVERSADQLRLQAVKTGAAELTVTDSLGNAKTIELTSASTVLGLSESTVTLTDGEEKKVKIRVAEGKPVTEDIQIISKLEGLTVSRSGNELSLLVEKGKYVTGKITVKADGQTYSLNVETKNRITSCSVSYPVKSDKSYRDLAKKGTAYLKVETLSGTLDDVTVSGPWQIAATEANTLELTYTGQVKELAKPCDLNVLLGGKQAKTLTVEYPNVVLTLPESYGSRKAGSALVLTVGEDSFQTLFGTLDGIECTGEGLTITQEGSNSLRIVRDKAGTSTLKLVDKQGKSYSWELRFDAYLTGVKANDKTASTGKTLQVEMTEGDSLTITLQIEGGSRSELSSFAITSNSSCAEITGTGSKLTLKANTPGSVTFKLADEYGSITLKATIAKLWQFPNEETTAEEIQEVSAALRALDFQSGRITSKWNDNLENGIRAWKKARGYADEAVLYREEYEQLLSEGGVELDRRTATVTPVPAFQARSGEYASLRDIASGAKELYLLDDKGWVVVMSKAGSVLDAFPAEESARFTQLYDSGDIPLAQDGAQLYLLNGEILSDVVSMYEHENSDTYLYNILTDMQSDTVSGQAAMSQSGMVVVLSEDQSFSVGDKIINMRQGQVLYSLNDGGLTPLYANSGKTTLCSKVTAAAVEGSTFVMVASNQLYLYGESSSLLTHYGLKNTQRQPATLKVVVDGKTLQLTGVQVVMTDKNIAIRQNDGTVLVGGVSVPGDMGQTVKNADTFSVCYTEEKAKDIALSDTTLYILTSGGSVYAQGKGSSARCTQLLGGIAAISADDTYGYAITVSGDVYRMDGCSIEQIANQVRLP